MNALHSFNSKSNKKNIRNKKINLLKIKNRLQNTITVIKVYKKVWFQHYTQTN